MNRNVKRINRFFMLATAPFIGLLLVMLLQSKSMTVPLHLQAYTPSASLDAQSGEILHTLDKAETIAVQTSASIEKTTRLYNKTTTAMSSIVKAASIQAARPEQIYNRRITSKLGAASERVNSDKIHIELYRLNPGTYKAYAMKIKLKDPHAMKMTLGKDAYGGAETTLTAVQRYGAIAGINAGGFADAGGKRYPLSTTVLNGQYLNGFEATFKDLFFVGLNRSGKLIGGKFTSQAKLDALRPSFGASFVPVLIQNGKKTPIPAKWQKTPLRAPRTVIGKYKDDQIIIMTADGYNENGSSGATLQELQDKMYKMGVIDAYNLDGGGSTSLILNGRVVNRPSDGNLRPVATNFLFFK
ncbi:phosphodiester glycosidase family protein [Paenibacillus bovis]|uniref:Exopolysaccharide biosynthesis protein n=1 Tax=Paenibacillus bovis TaxID=1616788 RepID=A0A172ZGE4_9BACL|nr:phosphodiester glycosidase family protein [Paenibacillus bovis]ANF96200.1 exopolysaccharide biosynthesis protein [Paenibacillus bovis]